MNCKRCGRNVPIRSKVCPSCGLDNPNWQPRPEETYRPPQQSRPQSTYTQSTHTKQTANSQPFYSQSVAQQPQAKAAAPSSNSKGSWKTVALIAVVILAVILVAKNCFGNPLKGTWTMAGGGGAFTFVDDSTGYVSQDGSYSAAERTKDFTYVVEGNELEIKTETTLYSYGDVMRFTFEISGDKLTLTEIESGESMTFYKD